MEHHVDEEVVTAPDFSVQVSHLPPRLARGNHKNYEALLREHFTAIVRAQRARLDHSRQGQPVHIAEVTLARQQHRALALLLRKGRLL